MFIAARYRIPDTDQKKPNHRALYGLSFPAARGRRDVLRICSSKDRSRNWLSVAAPLATSSVPSSMRRIVSVGEALDAKRKPTNVAIRTKKFTSGLVKAR